MESRSKSRIIIVSLFLSLSINAFTQNVNNDHDCGFFNTTIFTQYLIDFKGKKFVSELLENDIGFLMFLKVDSSGYVLELEWLKTRSKLPEHFKEELSHRFKTHPVSFFICFQYPHGGISQKGHLESLKKIWRDEGILTYENNVGFPAELMIGYEYEKKEAEKQGKSLSKYDYLISTIKKYKYMDKMKKYKNK